MQRALREVFDIYQPDLMYRYFCLLDYTNGAVNFYHAPNLELVDCLDKKRSEYNLDTSVIERLVIHIDKLQNRHILRVSGVKATAVVVSLMVAESILRRKIQGVRLTPVELLI